jgi:hypothetical protein
MWGQIGYFKNYKQKQTYLGDIWIYNIRSIADKLYINWKTT